MVVSVCGADPRPGDGESESVLPDAGPAMAEMTTGRDGVVGCLRAADRLVVVSPHLDDAVLAVGGLIARRRAVDLPVEVMTVYTEGGADGVRSRRGKAFGDYTTRVSEDRQALETLDAACRHLGFRERAMREQPLVGPRQLFRSTVSVAEDPEIAYVQTEIRRALGRPDTVVLAPLGIGNHVDHVAVAVAALGVAATHPARDRILFYEDFNALAEGCRRRHPVSRQNTFPWWSSPAWASPVTGALVEAMTAFVRGPDPVAIVGGKWGVATMRWSCHPVPVSEEFESAKFRAIGRYRSQTAVLGGQAGLVKMMRRSHLVRGGELLWQARTASEHAGVGV